jgi:hypothetical protein
VLAFANVFHFLVDELAGLRAGRLSFPLRLPRPLEGLSFGDTTPLKSRIDVGFGAIVGSVVLC